MLILASEVPGPCVLDSVQLLCGSDEYNHGVFQNAGVYCCHTTVTELDSTFDENYEGNTPVPAMSPTVLNLVWQNDNWHGLGFDDPFPYNGTDNLIMEFRWQGDDNNSVYDRGWYTPGNRACNASSSTAPSGTPRNYMPRFRIFYSAVGITEEAPLSEARHDMRTATIVATPPVGPMLDVLGRPANKLGPGVYFVPTSSFGQPATGWHKVVLTR